MASSGNTSHITLSVKPRRVRANHLSYLSALLDAIQNSLDSTPLSWEISQLLDSYQELGSLLNSGGFTVALLGQCVGLLLSDAVCLENPQSYALFARTFQQTLARCHRKLKHAILTGRTGQRLTAYTHYVVATVFKQAVDTHVTSKHSLSVPETAKLLSAIELVQQLEEIPFSWGVQAIHNVFDSASTLTLAAPPLRYFFTGKTAPFLPEYSHKSYTLVLDLDGTLGCMREDKFVPRPHVGKFLEDLSDIYELVCFTAGCQLHAYQALQQIDPKQYIQLILHRDHLQTIDGTLQKDLGSLGRDLRKVLIVDDTPANFQKYPSNGLTVSSWQGNQKDDELKELRSVLQELAARQPSDVREYTRFSI